MTPPHDPTLSETLQHAVEALERSDRPLTCREILEVIPPPSRVEVAELERLVQLEQARLWEWPASRGAKRYWTRQPEALADVALTDLLRDAALSSAALEKKLSRYLPGYPAKSRPKLLSERVGALVEAGKLFRHPRLGKVRSIKYSVRPAAAADYVRTLRKQLDELAKTLASAGVTRDAILAALREEDRGDELPQRILEYLKGKPGGVSVGRLRQEFGFPIEAKAPFDAAVLSLYRPRRVYLDRHDFPQGLDEAERNELVTDGSGNYFVVIGLRDADAESSFITGL